jgi:hypothetical protein
MWKFDPLLASALETATPIFHEKPPPHALVGEYAGQNAFCRWKIENFIFPCCVSSLSIEQED